MAIVTRWKRINNYLDRQARGEEFDEVERDLGGLSCHPFSRDEADVDGTEVYGHFVEVVGARELKLKVKFGGAVLLLEDGPDIESRFGDLAQSMVDGDHVF